VAEPSRSDRPVQPFFDKQGRATVERRGLPRDLGGGLAKDAYHFLVTSTWTRMLLFLFLFWIAVNLVFAAVLFFGDAQILNARDGSFLDRFWFSVQTMGTIGYGYMVPMDTLAHTMVTIESLAGILITALVTGLFFSKFSRPNAKVLFSRVAVIADHDGERTLMIRMANARSTAIVEATAHLTMTRDERLASGQRFRRVHDLHLRRTTSPVFALSWTIFHVIDARSPLHGMSREALADGLTNFVVTFTGIDDSLAAAVHTRASYAHTDLRYDEQFVDILIDDPNGRRYLDFSYFHETRPIVASEPLA
jgi:inward rectifier potassium channel